MSSKEIKKNAERSNIFAESKNSNLVHSLINAVTKGFDVRLIVEDILELIRKNQISEGVLKTAPDALRSYSDSIATSLLYIADQIDKIEIINEPIVRIKGEKDLPLENLQIQGLDSKNEEDDINEELEKHEVDEEDDEEEDIIDESQVEEDWTKSNYDESNNKLSGKILLNMDKNLEIRKVANKFNITKSEMNEIYQKSSNFLVNEYKNLKKSSINSDSFKNVKVLSLNPVKFEIDYEISSAF